MACHQVISVAANVEAEKTPEAVAVSKPINHTLFIDSFLVSFERDCLCFVRRYSGEQKLQCRG
ncbi:Uncharacterised protein [Vibrio cholerae]|nr:Uncharacterised protein [Vibrio cholerae]